MFSLAAVAANHRISVSPLRIPDSIGRDIEKKCQSIYPLHDVYIRKVKVLKKPKFDGEFGEGGLHLETAHKRLCSDK